MSLITVSAFAQTGPLVEVTTTRKETFLGVVTEPVPEAVAAQLGNKLPAKKGLLVTRVLPKSPAAAAGLQPFDVITNWGEQTIESSDQLKSLAIAQPSGQQVKVGVIRGGQPQIMDVTLAERPVATLVQRAQPTPANAPQAAAQQSPPAKSNTGVDPLVTAGETSKAPYQLQVETAPDSANCSVVLSYEAKPGEQQKIRIAGTPEAILGGLKQIPAGLREQVRKQLQSTLDDPAPKALQLRCQPVAGSDPPSIRISLRQPTVAGTVQALEVQQIVGNAVTLDELLKTGDLAARVRELDPAVRGQLEKTLREMPVPSIRTKQTASQ